MADRIITVTNPSIVTNDTLAGYNNYSDVDGQLGTTMTPTEAANGHTVALSDGSFHEVTTRPVGTINGEFSSVISNAVQVDLSGWDLASLTYDSVSEPTGATSLSAGIQMTPDGTKLIISDFTAKTLRSLPLGTPYDITSAGTAVTHAYSDITGAGVSGITFNDDGSKIYVCDSTDYKVNEYNLSVAYDITTATFVQSYTYLDLNAIAGVTFQMTGANAGKKAWISARKASVPENNEIVELTLSTAWDLSTASVSNTYDYSAISAEVYGLIVSSDGRKLWMVDITNTSIFELLMATPFDLATASYNSVTVSISGQLATPRGLYALDDGSKLFVVGDGNVVYRYSV